MRLIQHCFVPLQTCYEMERYLKDEPKNQTFKKIPENARCSWYEVRSLEDFTDHRLDGLSSSSSPMSWDGALSCAVLVKQVRTRFFFLEI